MKKKPESILAEAYPLQWPEGWARTQYISRNHRYQCSHMKAVGNLKQELRLLGAESYVISSNLPVKRNGEPYASSSEPDDPGVAVYWSTIDYPNQVIACDKWDKVHHNIHAVGLAISALRSLERTGASEILDRAFRAFGALPARAAWWQVLGFNERPSAWGAVKEQHRKLAREHHPDRGGNLETMSLINQALEDARKEVWSD